jgi:hypothetical protein
VIWLSSLSVCAVAAGINMRHLGLLRFFAKTARVRRVLLREMVKRTLKNMVGGGSPSLRFVVPRCRLSGCELMGALCAALGSRS